ncbi:MAG: rhomboid-like protein, partial [Candidatus Nanopelagicaceae bacterium]
MDRWPALNPARHVWKPQIPRIASYIRSAPDTYIYLFILLITTWVLQISDTSIAHQLIIENSTNVYRLIHEPARVLFSSAFWVPNFAQWLI